MMFQDLPDELFQEILVRAVLVRGVKRGLRLRLVCQLFSNRILPALFESRLLDDFHAGSIADCHIQNDYGAGAFWHSYLVYRVQNEASTGQRRFLDIHRVSKKICEEETCQLDVTTAIEELCWPALPEVMWHSHANIQVWVFSDLFLMLKSFLEDLVTISSKFTSENCKTDSETIHSKKPSNPGLDLLSAAAYLNVISLAKRLLQEGYRPTSMSHIFLLSPMGLAAWAGNAEMIQLFQENMPESDENDENGLRDSLMGVAIRGDIKLAHLAVYPPSRARPDSTEVAGQQFGKLERFVGAGIAMTHAQHSTRNVELYRYFESFFAEANLVDFILVKHARLGNLEMVRHLLDTGAEIRGTHGRWGNPLCCAARGCHEDIVDLLLERGADPNFCGDRERCQGPNPIWTAAQAGSLAIVRKLIDHGGYLSLPKYGELIMKAAIFTEHTGIVELLLDLGVDPGRNEELARSRGLDSMVEILQKAKCSVKE